jgi:hypothetical protein
MSETADDELMGQIEAQAEELAKLIKTIKIHGIEPVYGSTRADNVRLSLQALEDCVLRAGRALTLIGLD